MGLRDLIFESKGEDKKPKQKKEDKGISFPKATKNAFDGAKPVAFLNDEIGKADFGKENFGPPPTTGWKATKSLASCEPHMDNVMNLYEQGFDNLNQDGYDFYEYYKAVLEAGADNPAIYKMALTMAKAMDPGVSKESLIKQSEFYLTEIANVYKSYESQGKKKKVSIETEKGREEEGLRIKLEEVKQKLVELEALKGNYESSLSSIDNKYAGELHDIDCKLEANNVAKREIFESINKVKQGINTNI